MIIVVTGQDGSGKTTLIHQLKQYFIGKKVRLLHLPYSTFAAKTLKISVKGTPFGDVHTDRLIFALDNRLVHYELVKLQPNYDIIILQRGWMDSFIHGAVQGYSYAAVASLTRAHQLITPNCSIYLNCKPQVAYNRIQSDLKKDKFETPQYLKKQFRQTKRFYNAINKQKLLSRIFHEPRMYLDTTFLTPEDTFTFAAGFVAGRMRSKRYS